MEDILRLDIEKLPLKVEAYAGGKKTREYRVLATKDGKGICVNGVGPRSKGQKNAGSMERQSE